MPFSIAGAQGGSTRDPALHDTGGCDDLRVTIEIFVAYPPDREGPVAELHVPMGDTVEVPAEVYDEGGQLMVTLFSQADGPAWRYPLSEIRDALDRAAQAIRD